MNTPYNLRSPVRLYSFPLSCPDPRFPAFCSHHFSTGAFNGSAFLMPEVRVAEDADVPEEEGINVTAVVEDRTGGGRKVNMVLLE